MDSIFRIVTMFCVGAIGALGAVSLGVLAVYALDALVKRLGGGEKWD